MTRILTILPLLFLFFVQSGIAQDCRVEITRATNDANQPILIANTITTSTQPVSYKWSNGATTRSIRIGDALRYCVEVLTADSCRAKDCIELPSPSLCKVEISRELVNAGVKLTAHFKPADGVEEWKWSNGSTDRSIIVNESDEYCVKARFKGGCTDRACIDVKIDRRCDVKIKRKLVDGGIQLTAHAIPEGHATTIRWSTGETTRTIVVQKPGEYCAKVTFDNECTASACINIESDKRCSVEISRKQVDGDIQLTAHVKPADQLASLKWSTGDTTRSIIVTERGKYCVGARFANDCSAEKCVVIGEDKRCSVEISRKQVDGGIQLTAHVKPADQLVSLKWSTGDTTRSIIVTERGKYCVGARFANDCSAEKCVVIGEDKRCAVEISRKQVDGGIQLTAHVKPADQLVSLKWSTGDTTRSIIVTERGKYCVGARFANDCSAEECVVIGDDKRCAVEISRKQIDGGIQLTAHVKPADQLVSLKWSTGDTTRSIIVTERGKYCVGARFANDCSAEKCIAIGIDQDCKVEIVRELKAAGILLIAKTRPNDLVRKIIWNTGDTTQRILVTESGEYCVEVIFANQCRAKDCIKVDLENACRIKISRMAADSGIILKAHVFPNSVTYLEWSTGDTTRQIVVTEPGEYCVKAQFANGCSAKECVKVSLTDCKVKIRKTSSGNLHAVTRGPGPFEFLWNTGETTRSIHVTDSGEYCVTVVNGVGCTATACVLWNGISPSVSLSKPTLSAGKSLTAAGINKYKSGKNALSLRTTALALNRLYPNPVDQQMTYEIDIIREGKFYLLVENLAGQRILNEQITLSKGIQKGTVIVQQFPPGLYIFKIGSDYEWVTMKFIKK